MRGSPAGTYRRHAEDKSPANMRFPALVLCARIVTTIIISASIGVFTLIA